MSARKRKTITPQKTRQVEERRALREAEMNAYVEGQVAHRRKRRIANIALCALLVVFVIVWIIMFGQSA